MKSAVRLAFLAVAACAGCAAPSQALPAPDVRSAEPGFHWEGWSTEAFARARRERRYVLLSGGAEWCRWRRLMDETTYLDPAVQRLLGRRFVAIRVDVTARPDLAERFGSTRWPSTMILSPDASELESYTGYVPPAQMVSILSNVEEVSAAARRKAAPD